MGKVRMLHPSSGRLNFDPVSDQASQAANQNATQMDNKGEIEGKTETAIQAALASQPQGSSNTTNSNK